MPISGPPVSLESIAGPQDRVIPDANAVNEQERLENEKRETDLKETQQNIAERRKYAGRIFWLAAAWLAAVLVIVTVHGIQAIGFELSEASLIALITTTTGSVLGSLLIVMRYLFPGRSA